MSLCPCGTGSEYSDCCEPLIRGVRPAPTALALMRSRFSAYAQKEVEYVYQTTHPDQRRKVDRESIQGWADSARFRRLEILRTVQGGEVDDTGLVEFIAHYEESGEERQHHEHARFARVDGKWYFDHRRSATPPLAKAGPAVGRNDPCPCGSGKKFKKCCGAR